MTYRNTVRRFSIGERVDRTQLVGAAGHTAYIYALQDPNTMKTYYVGRTQNPCQRLREHIYSRSAWIRALLQRGVSPQLMILDCASVVMSVPYEREWIGFYKAIGAPLLNKTQNCEGGLTP